MIDHYSPLPSPEDIARFKEKIPTMPKTIPTVDLNVEEELRTFEALAEFYEENPFQAEATDGLRYWFQNPMYGLADAICLYGMMRHLEPKKIIEVGCGYSSCVMLDTNELFFENRISCTFKSSTILVPAEKNRFEEDRGAAFPASRCQLA